MHLFKKLLEDPYQGLIVLWSKHLKEIILNAKYPESYPYKLNLDKIYF